MKKITAKPPVGLDLFFKTLVDTLNKPVSTSSKLDQQAVVLSVGYSQSEATQVANNLKLVADKVDELIEVLKNSNLLSS